jgi:DHA1 family inner membrane transport protein
MAVDGAQPSSQPAVKRVCLALACANFTQGMGAFVVLRVVPLVARALSASLWQAARSSPCMRRPTRSRRPCLLCRLGDIDRTRVLCAGLIMLGAGPLAATLASYLPMLLLAR